MFKHILIATDGSPVANRAAKAGIALASRLAAKITACSAVEMPQELAYAGYAMDADIIESIEEQARVVVQKRVAAIAKMASAARVPCMTVVTNGSPIYKAIVETAKKRKCDAIVMGSHGRRGFSRLILGSITQQILAHTRLPVLVFR